MAIKKNRKRIVVDASVARAAGGEDATFPQSKHCRDLLTTILNVCHGAVITPPIRDEWNKHQSIFALQWRRQMISRKKLILIVVNANKELRSKVTANTSEKDQVTMLKDFHLLEAALATDQIVISLDNKVRKLFSIASSHAGEIGEIIWEHPDAETILAWLADGAKTQPELQIRRYVEPQK